MRCYHLFEDAEKDITFLRQAEMVATKFFRWLAVAGENQTVEDIMQSKRDRGGVIYFVTAARIGLPKEFDDLSLGIGKQPTGVKGVARLSRTITTYADETVRTKYQAVLFLAQDPGKITDIGYKLSSVNREHFVHEIIHYLDRKRHRGKVSSANSKKPGKYYNSDTEFNSYFQQGAHNILKNLLVYKTLDGKCDSFDTFRSNVLVDFDEHFRQFMSKRTRARFNRRLYKLWDWIREKYPQVITEDLSFRIANKIIPVAKNPTVYRLRSMLKDAIPDFDGQTTSQMLRGQLVNDDVYVWDGYYGTHGGVTHLLAIPYESSTRCYFHMHGDKILIRCRAQQIPMLRRYYKKDVLFSVDGNGEFINGKDIKSYMKNFLATGA